MNDVMDLFDIEGQEAKEAEAAPVETLAEPVVAAVEPETPVEPAVEPDVVEPEATEVEAPVVPAEPAESLTEGANLYMGKYKTPEAMQEAFTEYQSHADRKLAEEQAKNQAYEHMASLEAQQQQQLMQMEQQAAQQPAPVSAEDFDAGVKQAPIDTYKHFVQTDPSQVPKVISAVAEEHGMATAMELQNNWTQIQLMAQQEQMQGQMQQQYEQIMAPQLLRQSIEQGLGAVEQEYGKDFDALRGETQAKLAEMGKLPSYDPQTVANAVRTSFLQAHRERAMKAASTAASQGRTPAPGETVETGTPGNAPPTATEEEAIFTEIVNYGKS